MRVESLALFLSVAQHRSISHAARQHFISQQGASSIIKGLEAELEAQLFDRTPGGLQLTAAGKAVAREAAVAVSAYRRMQIAAAVGSGGLDGEALTVMASPFVVNRLDTLFQEYEAVATGNRPRIIERSLFDIVRTYDRDEADVLHLVAVSPFMERIAHRVRNDFSPLVECELMVACSASHPFATRDFVTPEDLAGTPLACYGEEFLGRLVGHMLGGGRPNVVLRTSNQAMIARAVASGEAVTFTDSLSAFMERPDPHTAAVPIKGAVSFSLGVLGKAAPGSAAEVFAHSLERYLATSCASYMERRPGEGAADEAVAL